MAATDKLHTIIHSSTQMLLSLIDLGANKEIEQAKDRIQQLRRRAYIMSLLNEKLLIAVTGLQGVGKSSLISNLYGFENENSPFLTNQGQGETLPVLVTESENPGKYYIHRVIRENYSSRVIKDELHSIQEFQSRCHKYNKEEDLFLEVIVPYKIFHDEKKGFLLLPGFQSTTDYLKELTYSALRSSMNCIVLFYQAKYSQRDNRDLIQTLKDDFKGASPLFVITWSDNEDSNKSLASDVKLDLDILENDRVIRTGAPGPKIWREELINSIKKYSLPVDTVVNVKQRNLQELVRDFNDVISAIKLELRNYQVNLENKEYRQVDLILKEFRNESKKVEDILCDQAKSAYAPYFNRVVKCVNQKIKQKYGGIGGFFNKLLETWTLSITLNEELNAMIQDCLDNANDCTIEQQHLILLNRTSNRHWKDHNFIMNLPEERQNQISYEKMFVGENSNSNDKILISDTVSNDLTVIFGDNRSNDAKLSQDLQYSIRLLPALILELTRTSAFMRELTNGTPKLVIDVESRTDLVEMYQLNKGDLFKGLAAILTFDLVEGNSIDLFGFIGEQQAAAAAKSAAEVTATSSATATAAMQVNWLAVGLVSVSVLAYLTNQVLKSIDRRAENMERQVGLIQEHVVNNIQLNYRKLMDNYEQLIRERLMKKFELHKDIANISNCHLAVKRLENSVIELNKEVGIMIK